MTIPDTGVRPVYDIDQEVDARPVGTVFQQNAAAFASQPEDYAAQERRAACREAVQLYRTGEPGRAYSVVMRSYIRQVRILGLSYAGIPGKPYEEGGPLS